jgi:chromosome segregation ATPase
LGKIQRASQNVSNRAEILLHHAVADSVRETKYLGPRTDEIQSEVRSLKDNLKQVIENQATSERKLLAGQDQVSEHFHHMATAFEQRMSMMLSQLTDLTEFGTQLREIIQKQIENQGNYLCKYNIANVKAPLMWCSAARTG